MKTWEINEIIQSLPKGRTVFHYFKDRYAVQLLGDYVGDRGRSVRDIKSSRYGRLLGKPIMKDALSAAGNGQINRKQLRSLGPASFERYELSLGEWGRENPRGSRWYQTSVPGKNLVLHLNFGDQYVKAYTNAIHPRPGYHPFTYGGHPHNKGKNHTLAWARLEIDLERNEALIEEIQTDWLRRIRSAHKLFQRHFVYGKPLRNRHKKYLDTYYQNMTHPNHVLRYFEMTERVHGGIWSEAMLFAAIGFLRHELGIEHIFYHTHETGSRLKCISYDDSPPRSLYTDLPERFCFRTSLRGPAVVERAWPHTMVESRKKLPFKWQVLEL
jgi:hypothetical protein